MSVDLHRPAERRSLCRSVSVLRRHAWRRALSSNTSALDWPGGALEPTPCVQRFGGKVVTVMKDDSYVQLLTTKRS